MSLVFIFSLSLGFSLIAALMATIVLHFEKKSVKRCGKQIYSQAVDIAALRIVNVVSLCTAIISCIMLRLI